MPPRSFSIRVILDSAVIAGVSVSLRNLWLFRLD
jgi:hypothetical protein